MYGGFGKGRWGRKQSWDEMNTNLTFESGAVLDARAKDSSVYVKNLIKRRPNQSSFIYIGPWKYVKKIGKEIRFVATQGNLYGGIRSFYESKTPENAKIKATKKITLARSPEKNMQYCEVLWTKTYGYNGVMDIESNYPSGIFTGKIMKGSGKIIQAEE